MTNDPVNHPSHYTSDPSGVECITITRHRNFNIGNAIKYLWRAGMKENHIQDLEKAIFYIKDEIERLKGIAPKEYTTTEAQMVTVTCPKCYCAMLTHPNHTAFRCKTCEHVWDKRKYSVGTDADGWLVILRQDGSSHEIIAGHKAPWNDDEIKKASMTAALLNAATEVSPSNKLYTNCLTCGARVEVSEDRESYHCDSCRTVFHVGPGLKILPHKKTICISCGKDVPGDMLVCGDCLTKQSR